MVDAGVQRPCPGRPPPISIPPEFDAYNDGPHYPDWNQDETALAEDYNSQDPATVSAELMEAAEGLAERFDSVVGEQWNRTGYRSDGASFTITSFARYLIHDPVHHLWDVQQ